MPNMPESNTIRPARMACLGLFLGVALATLLNSTAGASDLRRTAIVRAVEKVRPSVVNIRGEKSIDVDDPFGGHDSERRVNGMGTGIVIDERGYILTNYHVVEDVQQIQITLVDKKTYIARLTSHDQKTDLAILKIDTSEPLPVIPLGSSTDLMPGEEVIAVGNAFGYEHTVTRGIISALHRTVQVGDTQAYEDLIQTDASINPGNSGGPLLNIDGELIGVNVAVRVGAQGIGFAIPVDKALDIAADLLSTRRIDKTWHGLVLGGATPLSVSQILKVELGSPAATANLQPGDIVTRVDGRRVNRAIDFERALLGHKSGEEILLLVRREDKDINTTLVLADAPLASTKGQPTIWRVLGLRLEQVPEERFRLLGARYRGGMEVAEVRENSSAWRQGIRRGDILVGMHHWETVSLENVTYVLKQLQQSPSRSVKFYVLRDGDTLYGHLTLASQVSQRRETR
jgi:serine protease Do